MKKLIALVLALAVICTASLSLAAVLEPEETELEHFAGKTFSATVGAYDEKSKTFTVIVYDYDQYEKGDVEKLQVGDMILAGGWLYRITGQEQPNETTVYLCEGGEEIYFSKSYEEEADEDELQARSTSDDRLFMSVAKVLHLPAAEGIVYEDDSNLDLAEPVVTEGLEAILAVQREKEETSIGFDFYSTYVTLNENLEIVKIHQDYDVAQ